MVNPPLLAAALSNVLAWALPYTWFLKVTLNPSLVSRKS